jgi:hypothetical protein
MRNFEPPHKDLRWHSLHLPSLHNDKYDDGNNNNNNNNDDDDDDINNSSNVTNFSELVYLPYALRKHIVITFYTANS